MPDDELMTALGDDITYKRGLKNSAVKAIVDHNVQNVGDQGYVVEPRTEVEFLKTAIPWLPQRGDVITVKAVTFTVQSIIHDDGVYVRVAVV